MADKTMREKIARAISEANMENFDDAPHLHMAMADAALAAMREPTNPMEHAAVTWVCDGNANGTNWIDTADFMKLWALAIDAARNEPGSDPKSTHTDSNSEKNGAPGWT